MTDGPDLRTAEDVERFLEGVQGRTAGYGAWPTVATLLVATWRKLDRIEQDLHVLRSQGTTPAERE